MSEFSPNPSNRPQSKSFYHHLRPAQLRGHLHFLSQYIRNPKQIGAVAASSPELASTMCDPRWMNGARMVVELGPGTGAVTGTIRERMGEKNGTFFALEINESMCEALRTRFPDANIYCDSAAELQKYLDKHGATQADCIISSIPWAAFDAKLQHELMNAVVAGLRPGGWFVTFTYVTSTMLPSGRNFRKKLEETFVDVTASPVVWRNIPPAFVYQCRKG